MGCDDDLSVKRVDSATFHSSAICIITVKKIRASNPDFLPTPAVSPRIEIKVFNVIASQSRIVDMRPEPTIRELVRLINMDGSSTFCWGFLDRD